uniref:Huntingtin-interacting protein 1-related protein n=1 Tax=Oncorhynchus tshawytscha TaxID=74940 RepID=A0A8C8H4A5_ONCTS
MWNDVELLINEDTNTGRLCNVREENSGLYQVDTLVKIASTEKVLSDPQLYSSSSSNCSIVVADSTVILFDLSYQTMLLHLDFDSDVDTVDDCLDGHFLVVCERNGNLHLIYVPQKSTLLTIALLKNVPSGKEKTYRHLILQEDKTSFGMYHLFLLTQDGFFHITNLALEKIQIAIEKMDIGALKELQSRFKTDFCSTKEIHGGGCNTAVMCNLGNEIHLMIGADGEAVLTHWRLDHSQGTMSLCQSLDSSLIPGVRKILVVDNLMYVLSTENILSLWDLHFLVMVCCWPDLSIHDFLLITECDSASIATQESASTKIITLTMQDKSQMRSLQVRSLPSMTVLYSLEVSSTACLVQTRISTDTIYLLEGIYENSRNSEEHISSVVMRCFTEALPENRLSRLLYKHKFEEAEKFAIAFELDVELVYKVKLDFVLEQLASASVGGNGQDVWSDLVEEAKTNLMKIMDEQYVVEYCLKAPWPTFDTAEKMLNHAASRCPSSQIQEALARLATFCCLHSLDKFNGISWIEFLNITDYVGDMLSHLREGDLKGAQHLWLRHEGEIAVQFDERVLDALLSSFPEDLPSQDLCLWLRSVIVPFVRRVVPRGQKIVARWLEQRARILELTEKGDWPQNGLNLAELGLPSLWMWIPSEDDYGSEEVEHLKSLVSNLRQLLDLYNKYNCRLSLSVFEKASVRSVAFLMLDKVPAPELIPATVEGSVRPYSLEHQLPLDELLLQYIKDLLERCSSQTTTLFTEWEAKAVAVLGCITDTDLVVDAVLEIMQKAVVPWTEVVERLVQQHLEMVGPKQELLKESYRLMEMRKLLRGYGIRNFNLSNNTQIMTLVRYILKQDLPTSLEDSLKLAGAYKLPTSQIHILYLIQLISQSQSEPCVTLLKKIAPEEAECVIERLANWARLELQDKDHVSEEHKKHQMVVAQVMVEALTFLQRIQKGDAFKSVDCENNLMMFKAIAHLQEDFDIFLTPNNYEDPKVRKQFQEYHITAYENTRARGPSKSKVTATPMVANDPDGKTKNISTEAGLRRLARQLQRTEQELWADLALRALGVGKVDKALKILSELYKHHGTTSTGKVLFSAAQKLCQMLEADVPMILPEGVDLPAVIHKLACQAVTVCHSDLLLDCVELCKSTRAAMDVYHQCQLSDNYGFIAKDLSLAAERDPYSQWSFQDVFKEDCIILDPVSVLPVQYEITNCLLPFSSDRKLYPLDCSCLSHCSFQQDANFLNPLLVPLASMHQMLQECSQLELALRLLVNSFGSCLQHVTSNIMNIKLGIQLYGPQALQKYRACLSDLRTTTLSSINAVAVALLHKVFNWRVVDCDLAIGLCTLLSKTEVFKILWKVIDNTWQNYDKILAVAMVGAHLCNLYSEQEERKKFLSVITDAEWGIELGKLGISIQSVFRQCPEMKSNLIPTLVKNKNTTPEIILQYCSTFDLNRDEVINQYITTLLQEEGGGAADPGAGQGEQPLGHADALERALQVIPMLHSTRNLTISLSAAILKLSPYNYERIEGVLRIIQTADEQITSISISQAIGLLQHLKSYKRISSPTDLESSHLLENGLEPSALANIRLPFHLLMQTTSYWKILSPELSEETFPTLLLISKLMKVNVDKLYMSAVNHVFEKSMKPLLLEQHKRRQKHTSSKETFKVAKTIMGYIHCIQNPEWAAATAHKIAQELPPGTEKTQSLKFCLALGDAWLKDPKLEEAARTKVETFLSKLKLQFQRSATENVLMSSQLNSPEHLKLTGQPARLIVILYEHSSVEQRFRGPAGQTHPDIHAVCKEIAAINSVDFLKIRSMLLEKWICKTGPAVAKDINNQDCVNDIQEDSDLMRVVYLLQIYSMDVGVCLLSPILSAETWPLSSSGPRLTFCHRSRALLCLIHIADPTTLETRLHIPKTQVQYYLKCYIYLSQLEDLNIPYTVESFLNSPKEGMVKGLWKNHSHEPQAVRLVADLSLEYQVFDPQLWNGLLQKLLGFNMISDLQKVLVALGAVPSLWQVSSFSRTWRSMILAPFVSASLPLSPQQQATLYRTFVLLLKCPFLLNLDLIGIANRFAQFSLPGFALGALLLIPCAKRKGQQIQGLLSACNPITILEQLDEHMNTGELAGVPSQIRDTVLMFICQNRQYQKLWKTKHFNLLKQHIVSSGDSNQVKNLVDYLISHSCEEDANSLAHEYLKHRERKGKLIPDMSPASSALKLSSISKAINSNEAPVKEKHARRIILGTHREKGAFTFWSYALGLPLSSNSILSWKFCHVVHKVLRDGHHNSLQDCMRHHSNIVETGQLWGNLHDRYGQLVALYAKLLCTKMEFHVKHSEIRANLEVTDEVLERVAGTDINNVLFVYCGVCYVLYIGVSSAVIRQLNTSIAISTLTSGQCRLSPLIQVIQDCSHLYHFTVKLLFKLHACLPADTLQGHRDRFHDQFHSLKTFFNKARDMMYFKRLIQIPKLPESPPNFLHAASLAKHARPVVVIPDEDEPEQVDDDDDDPEPLINVSDVTVDIQIENLKRDLELLRTDLERVKGEAQRYITQLKSQINSLEAELEEQRVQKQRALVENEQLRMELEATRRRNAEHESVQATFGEAESKRTQATEQRYNKLKEKHTELVSSHAELLRKVHTYEEPHSPLFSLWFSPHMLISNQMYLYSPSSMSALQAEKERLMHSVSEKEAALSALRHAAQLQQSSLQQERERSTRELGELQGRLQEKVSQDSTQKLLEEQFSLLQGTVSEAESIIQDAVAKLDDPLHIRCTSSPDYLVSRADATLGSIDKVKRGHSDYLTNMGDVGGLLRALTQFSHLAADTIINGSATAHMAPTDHADRLTENCRGCATQSLQFLKDLKSKASLQRADPASIRIVVQKILRLGEELRPKGVDVRQDELGDLVDKEMAATSAAIEEAVRRIDEMMNQARKDTSGVKLEVNERILYSCTDLMKAIHLLVLTSTDLQKEIVEGGRGAATIKEFYARNSRWTEGLISASKAVGWGATQMVESADKVVLHTGKYEELIVCSHEIAASTAQLVASSKVKADRNSTKLTALQQASRRVNEMAANVVASTKTGQENLEDKDTMDFSGMSLIKLKMEEMESQVKVLELENQLGNERLRLGELRKKHYDIGNGLAPSSASEPSSPKPSKPSIMRKPALAQKPNLPPKNMVRAKMETLAHRLCG